MTEWRSTCNHNYLYRWLPCQYFILLMMGAWRPKHVEKVCSNKICILLHHVSVLFNRNNSYLQLIHFSVKVFFFVADKLAIQFQVTSASNSGVWGLDYVDSCPDSVKIILFHTISRPNLFPNITCEIDGSIYSVSGQNKRTLQLVTSIHLRHWKLQYLLPFFL